MLRVLYFRAIYVGGHSAGGHLTAMLLSHDWDQQMGPGTSSLIKGRFWAGFHTFVSHTDLFSGTAPGIRTPTCLEKGYKYYPHDPHPLSTTQTNLLSGDINFNNKHVKDSYFPNMK